MKVITCCSTDLSNCCCTLRRQYCTSICCLQIYTGLLRCLLNLRDSNCQKSVICLLIQCPQFSSVQSCYCHVRCSAWRSIAN